MTASKTGPVFLGIDGGGTKTAYCLIDADGGLLATARTPTIYYLSIGLDAVRERLAQGVSEVLDVAGRQRGDVAHAFVGIPGYGDLPADRPALDALPSESLARYTCGNDVVCGWAGSLAARDGLHVVAGTGTIGYGRWRDREARCGGWGTLLGDEGSGYWVAREGLSLFTKMADGRLPQGPLYRIVRDELGLGDDQDVLGVVLEEWQADRAQVAALSRLVDRAADAGDDAARSVLDQAVDEVVLLAEGTRRRVGAEGVDRVPLSWSGGMFGSRYIRTRFAERAAGFDVREPLLPPDVGAAVLAARLAGAPLSDAALAALGATIQDRAG